MDGWLNGTRDGVMIGRRMILFFATDLFASSHG
jgi:hypothetical protein